MPGPCLTGKGAVGALPVHLRAACPSEQSMLLKGPNWDDKGKTEAAEKA